MLKTKRSTPMAPIILSRYVLFLGYTNASFPNSLGHERQNDAGLEIQNFAPLIKVCGMNFFGTLYYA